MTVQIVLAAGRSERMRSPKPLLRFGTRTALEVALGAAGEAGVERSVVVVGESGDDVLALHENARRSAAVSWVWNREPGAEQLRSLQLALQSVAGERVDAFFIHPVDCPLATSWDYKLLLEAVAQDNDAHDVFILSHGGRRGHPILCRDALIKPLRALRADATARDVIEKARIAYVLTPNPGVLEDMDTPEDYARLLRVYEASVVPASRRDVVTTPLPSRERPLPG